jgi:NADH dehydrogenase
VRRFALSTLETARRAGRYTGAVAASLRQRPPHDRDPAETLVTVFGGSGFLGRHVVRALAREGYRVRPAVRRPDLAGHLQPLGRVGQIHAVQANLRYPESVVAAVRGADVVVNLVGILFERGKQSFDACRPEGAACVARAARPWAARVVHVSALGADPDSPALYGRSKAAGEGRRARGRAGRHDPAALDPVRPGGRFLQPVCGARPHVAGAAADRRRPDQIPAGVRRRRRAGGDARGRRARPKTARPTSSAGPEVKTFRALMDYVLAVTERKRLLVPLPFGLARLQAMVLQLMPKPLLTPDQVELLRTDNIVSDARTAEGRTLKAFGIEPAAMEAIVPGYLWRFRKAGQFRGRVA